MPRYQPSDDDMDSGYGNAAPVTPPGDEAAEPAAPAKPSVDEENSEAETAVVSNKILSPDGEPLNEGDEVVLRVVKNYGDECEVKYAPKSGEGEEATETETPSAADELAALDKENA